MVFLRKKNEEISSLKVQLEKIKETILEFQNKMKMEKEKADNAERNKINQEIDIRNLNSSITSLRESLKFLKTIKNIYFLLF